MKGNRRTLMRRIQCRWDAGGSKRSNGWSSTQHPTRSRFVRHLDRLPGLLFVRVPEAKTVKNRLHLDLRPDDQDSEVDRLLCPGGGTGRHWARGEVMVVLADPEGNEFCVLGERSLKDRQDPVAITWLTTSFRTYFGWCD